MPGTTLVIGGTGPEEKRLKRLAARTGGRVIFAGRVAHSEAPGLYAAANVFVLPVVDRWFGLEIEGLGVVLLEAQAAGTPCVTGRSGGTPEAVLEGTTGFVVDGRDRSAVVAATARLLSDPALSATMAAAGREHVRAEFSERPLPETLRTWLS
jgi:phosphatidylinositol alpha-1,6-mannosyltransferase